MTLIFGSHDESLMVLLSLDRLENYMIERLHVSTHISLNKLYTTFQVIQFMAECFEHSYWNLLNEVIHTEITLLTKKEMV